MKAVFLGKYTSINEEASKISRIPIPMLKIDKWEKFYEHEVGSLEFKEGSCVNIDGSEETIDKVIYELDGSITYKTSKILDGCYFGVFNI